MIKTGTNMKMNKNIFEAIVVNIFKKLNFIKKLRKIMNMMERSKFNKIQEKYKLNIIFGSFGNIIWQYT